MDLAKDPIARGISVVDLAKDPIAPDITVVDLAKDPIAPGITVAGLAKDPIARGITVAGLAKDPIAPGITVVDLAKDPIAPGITVVDLAKDPIAPDITVVDLAKDPIARDDRGRGKEAGWSQAWRPIPSIDRMVLAVRRAQRGLETSNQLHRGRDEVPERRFASPATGRGDAAHTNRSITSTSTVRYAGLSTSTMVSPAIAPLSKRQDKSRSAARSRRTAWSPVPLLPPASATGSYARLARAGRFAHGKSPSLP